MSHSHLQFVPTYEPKYINSQKEYPMIDVVRTGALFEYAPRIGGSMFLELATTRFHNGGAIAMFRHGDFSIKEYRTLEDKLEVELLPVIAEMPTKEKPLPKYDVKLQSQQVVAKLFDKASDIYLPGYLKKHPDANLILLTHGRIWTPELEQAIMQQLSDAGFKHDSAVHHMFGELSDTNGIVLLK